MQHPASLKIKFTRSSGFHEELRNSVGEYFKKTKRLSRDNPQMYLKAGSMLAWLAGSYIMLVFFANSFWSAVACSIFLGLAMTGVGFNVQHDANHESVSKIPFINRTLGFSLDLLGISSYVWRWKHNQTHHYYTSIVGVDEDLETDGFGRLAPFQPYLWHHRYQHVYIWFLYALMMPNWQIVEDFGKIIRGGLKTRKFPSQKTQELISFFAGKLVFFSLAIFVPLFFHPWWIVLLGYALASMVFSASATVILQLAHCSEDVMYSHDTSSTNTIPVDWAHHQLNTTVNFAPQNKALTWLLGGLNFQIEHHLFPKISHVHYPKIAPIVQETCKKFGLPYRCHNSLWQAIKSHYGYLKQLGKPATLSIQIT